MKKFLFNILQVILLASLYGCIEDPDVEPGVKGAGVPKFEGTAVPGERTATTIKVSANIITANGAKITERGFYYGTNSLPTPENGGKEIKDLTDPAEIGIGPYALTIEGLDNNTTYYILPYAKNSEGIGQGTRDTAIHTNQGWASVKTLKPDETCASTVRSGGMITFAGEGKVEKLGVYVSENKNFAIVDTFYFDTIYPITVLKDETFFCKVTDLTPSTCYYVQAFVKNAYATTTGGIDSVCTLDGKPGIGETKIKDKGFTEVTLTSSVNNGGDKTVIIIEHGFCWAKESETSEPTISNNTIQVGEGEGNFEGTITNLVPKEHYYARAYAKTNLDIVVYARAIPVQTKTDIPTVTTGEITKMLNGNVDVKGVIDNEGMSPVNTSGICWSSINPEPTVLTDHILPLSAGIGGAFSGQLTGLRGGVSYYVRAYAVNAKGAGYGNVVKITTPSIFTGGLKPFSGDMRLSNSMAYFAIDGYLYILGGDLGASYTDELWRYSVAKDSWEPRHPFDGGPMKWQSGVAYGRTGAFAYGGHNGNHNEKPGIYYYDATDENKWEYYEGPDTVTVCRIIGYSSSNSVFYVGGKSVDADTIREDVWSFDFPAKTWQKKTDFPVKQYGGVAVVIDNIAYVGMGKDASGTCNGSLWTTIDGALTWNSKTSYAVTGSVLAGVACNKRLYMIDESYYILEYNPETNGWTKKTQLPEGYRSVHCMYTISNKIYIGLGSSKSFVVYDPSWDNE